MKRINIKINDVIIWSAYKSNSEYQSWIDSCVAANLWGAPGTYVVEVLEADAELELRRQSQELATKQVVSAIDSRVLSLENSGLGSHVSSINNPHSTTKDQVGLGNVDNIAAADLRDRSTHTGTQLSSTISDFTEAAQDAVGIALSSTSNITFTYPDALNQISADLTDTGVSASTYNAVTVDSKGRVISGVNSGPVTRFAYTLTSNTAVSTNTYSTVAGLTTASLPIGLYKVSFSGRMQSGSTTSGVGVRLINGSSTVSTLGIRWLISQGASGTALSFQYDQLTTTTNLTSASTAAANTAFIVEGEGLIRITGAGTLVLQIRPESNGTAATLLTDSTLILELV